MQDEVAQLLKRRTAGAHERVESALALLDGPLTIERVRVVLARFAGFWQGTERGLDRWAAAHPDAAAALSWRRRRRGEAQRRDLLHLGLTVRALAGLPEAPAVFDDPDHAQVLGWLYVSEGAALGGAIIDRRLRALPAVKPGRLHTFAPYLEGPGPMWRSYLAQLHAFVGGDPVRREAVVLAAEQTFAALEDWLAPIAVRADPSGAAREPA